MNHELAQWLDIATQGLTLEQASRVRAEIEAHYQELLTRILRVAKRWRRHSTRHLPIWAIPVTQREHCVEHT